LARSVLLRMSRSFTELKSFIAETIASSGPSKIFVILMENMAEGGSMPLETEIEMYASAVCECAPHGSMIVLKGHPGESLDRYSKMTELLSPNYRLISVPSKFKRIPYELWIDLIERSEAISLSYPSLSLPYLYGKRALNPANDQFVEKWCDPLLWNSFKNGLKLYRIPLENLATWNGKGLLARGPF
jgi:hypothetical protein